MTTQNTGRLILMATILFASAARAGLVTGCAPSPVTTCRAPGLSFVAISDKADNSKDKLKVGFGNGVPVPASEFDDPTSAGTDYSLCTYADGVLVAESVVPGGTLCGGAPCWVAKPGKGYNYKDSAGTHGGIKKMGFRASESFKTKLKIKGAGEALPDLTFPLAEPVVVQLNNSRNGVCYTTTFAGGDVVKNDAARGRFVAKSSTSHPIVATLRTFLSTTYRTGNMGGVSGADAICQAEADAAMLGGTWIAGLSSSTVDLVSRLAPAAYQLVDGTRVADDIEQLFTITIPMSTGPIEKQADGTLVGFHSIWTGGNDFGQFAGQACEDWTNEDVTVLGSGGVSGTQADGGSSGIDPFGPLFSGSGASCNLGQRFLCFEQP